MKWYPLKTCKPENMQEVLIRYRGIVGLAIYDDNRNCFLLKNGAIISVIEETIRWAELVAIQ